MTIGIAATGPWAGAGIQAGLRAVEAVGHGAIGGFVSLAVLTADQKLLRAETQNGGTRFLFGDSPPEDILRAPFAALISSGPNRPKPLSQFVAAAPGIGIVTGHRFPHVPADSGQALNELILEAMRQGATAQDAIDATITAYPGFDAGFIALSTGGNIGLGNMPSVLHLSDQGALSTACPETGARAAVLHNAILPSRAIATVACEVTLDEMRRRVTEVRTITVAAGLELSFGTVPEIHINDTFEVTRIAHPNSQPHNTETSFGIGDRVNVVHRGKRIGLLAHEPFMVVRNGAIITLDGKTEISLPVLMGGNSER